MPLLTGSNYLQLIGIDCILAYKWNLNYPKQICSTHGHSHFIHHYLWRKWFHFTEFLEKYQSIDTFYKKWSLSERFKTCFLYSAIFCQAGVLGFFQLLAVSSNNIHDYKRIFLNK